MSANYARELKIVLTRYGICVYLDVDEIIPGQDWQDELNNAIYDCNVFVALVTPNYGKTKWTKRELQLGDYLKKHIFPINFLDHWPPLSIAINMLATHFSPWKTDEDIKGHNSSDNIQQACDYPIWEERCVQRIAEEISATIRYIDRQQMLSSN